MRWTYHRTCKANKVCFQFVCCKLPFKRPIFYFNFFCKGRMIPVSWSKLCMAYSLSVAPEIENLHFLFLLVSEAFTLRKLLNYYPSRRSNHLILILCLLFIYIISLCHALPNTHFFFFLVNNFESSSYKLFFGNEDLHVAFASSIHFWFDSDDPSWCSGCSHGENFRYVYLR